MSHTQAPSGQIEPLQRFNVDTGMGLERTLAALCGVRTVYEIDTLAPILRVVRELVRNSSPDIERRLRVVTDHMRASCFLIADGVQPSNKKQGYVLRRLLRRSSVMARQLGFELDWHEKVIDCVRQTLGSIHPQLEGQRTLIEDTIQLELNRFGRTLSRGLRRFERLPIIDGRAAFDLYQTYGFPWELTRELAQERGQQFDLESFRKQFEEHQATSRGE